MNRETAEAARRKAELEEEKERQNIVALEQL